MKTWNSGGGGGASEDGLDGRSPYLGARRSQPRGRPWSLFIRVLPWDEKRRSSSFTRASRWRSHFAICRARRGCNLIGWLLSGRPARGVRWWHLYSIVLLRCIRRSGTYWLFSSFSSLTFLPRMLSLSSQFRIAVFYRKRIKTSIQRLCMLITARAR